MDLLAALLWIRSVARQQAGCYETRSEGSLQREGYTPTSLSAGLIQVP